MVIISLIFIVPNKVFHKPAVTDSDSAAAIILKFLIENRIETKTHISNMVNI